MSGGSAPIEALLLDVGHTLLMPRAPIGTSYSILAARHGIQVEPDRVQARFGAAFGVTKGRLKMDGDGRAFWKDVVSEAVGPHPDALFEDLYTFYSRPAAWRVAEGASCAMRTLRNAGRKICIVSNWDTRLRMLLNMLELDTLFDHIVVSGELGIHKPDPRIYHHALALLNLPASRCVHVGDHPVEDVQAANQAGCRTWLWGHDVRTMKDLAERILKS